MTYYSVINGISSLYQVGLENEIDRYTAFIFENNPSEPDFVEKSQDQRDILAQLGERLFNLSPNNPDVLSLLAYIETNNFWAGIEPELALERSRELQILASEIRPIGYDTYAEAAFTKLYQQQDFSEVLLQLQLAQHFGPYEFATARAGIEIMFDHWQELDREQRIQALDYLTSHKKYGIRQNQLNRLVGQSIHKDKLCNVARFVRLWLRTCH